MTGVLSNIERLGDKSMLSLLRKMNRIIRQIVLR